MTRTTAFKTCAMIMCAGLMLGGCGLRGKLETPPPMWGDDNRPAADRPAPNQDDDTDTNTL